MSKDRDPSIHISMSDLKKVFKALNINASVEEVLKVSSQYSKVNRNAIISTKLAESKITKESMDNNAMFKQTYKIYSMVVRSMHKFTPKRLKNGDTRTLSMITQVTNDMVDFCELHDLEHNIGFVEYLKIGLEKSPKLSYLVGSSETITEKYLSRLELRGNNNEALELHKTYSAMVLKYTGVEYINVGDATMLKFKRAAEKCKAMGITHETFVNALFEGLEWKSGIPSPSMFDSEYGTQLIYEYIGRGGVRNNNDFNTINLKNIGHGKSRD